MTTRTAMRFGAWVQQKAPPVKRDAVQSHDPSKSSLIQSVFRFRWRKNWRKWRKSAPSTASNPLSPSTSSVDGLHRGEEEDVADGVGVGEQHDQAIHAEAQAAGGGQDGLGRPSGDETCCGTRVFAFLCRCFLSAGRAVSSD